MGGSPTPPGSSSIAAPDFAKHQHLDQNQFTIYYNGYLAIDSGADYTETESPHYLNYYRRTVAHNTMLVYDPQEKFFWSDNLLPAANDGGQRMDSFRYWNTVRSRADLEQHPRCLGSRLDARHRLCAGPLSLRHGRRHRAYSRDKLKSFTREVLYVPGASQFYLSSIVLSAPNRRFEKPGCSMA